MRRRLLATVLALVPFGHGHALIHVDAHTLRPVDTKRVAVDGTLWAWSPARDQILVASPKLGTFVDAQTLRVVRKEAIPKPPTSLVWDDGGPMGIDPGGVTVIGVRRLPFGRVASAAPSPEGVLALVRRPDGWWLLHAPTTHTESIQLLEAPTGGALTVDRGYFFILTHSGWIYWRQYEWGTDAWTHEMEMPKQDIGTVRQLLPWTQYRFVALGDRGVIDFAPGADPTGRVFSELVTHRRMRGALSLPDGLLLWGQTGLWLYSSTAALRHHVLRGVSDVVARDGLAYARLANGRTAVVDVASGRVLSTSSGALEVLG
jgi:hypothetical protein